MSYLNLKDYNKVIQYLKDFNSDDVLLSSIAKGVLGDAYLQVGDQKNALLSYKKLLVLLKIIFQHQNIYTKLVCCR